jgi:hypothetical protein
MHPPPIGDTDRCPPIGSFSSIPITCQSVALFQLHGSG